MGLMMMTGTYHQRYGDASSTTASWNEIPMTSLRNVEWIISVYSFGNTDEGQAVLPAG